MNTISRQFEKERIRFNYKKVAWFYDFWSLFTESKASKYVLKFAEIGDNQRIIEIAVGTGLVFEKIVKQNQNGINIGIDLSSEMLNKAKERLSKSMTSNYELKEGNVLELEYKDSSFDRVINNFMVDLMPEGDFDRIAKEFYRILKPGGIAAVSTFSFGKKKVNRFWYWVALKFPDLLAGCRPVSFKENLIKAGFSIEDNREISQNTFPSEIIKARK